MIIEIKNSYKRFITSSLIRSSGVYTIASFTNAAIPFVLLPLLTTHLTPSDYGIITMFATVQAFLYPFIGVNLEGAIARKYYSKDTDFSIYIGNCILIYCCTTIIVTCLIFLYSSSIESLTKIPRAWIHIIPIVCAAQFLGSLALVLWQVKEKPLKYAGFQISQSLVNTILTIIFVIILSYNWTGRLIAISFTTTFYAILCIFIFWKQKSIKFIINSTYIKHALKYGGGLVPHAIGGILILMTNRIFLTKMVSIEESGIYGVANQICCVISILTLSFNNAYVPWLYKKLAENKFTNQLKIVYLTYSYFICILLIGLVYYLLQPIIFKFFIGIKFISALRYCFWITLGYIFQGMYFMVTNYIGYAEKTHIQALITIAVGLINIPLNYIFILYFGALGAAISFATIFCLFFVFTWLLSAKVYPMPWNIFKMNRSLS